jgi:hypothetical protein
MIPDDVAILCDRQEGGPGRDDVPCVLDEFEKLGIPQDSELAEIGINYNMAMLSNAGNSLEQLIDPCWPAGDMASAAEFVHNHWEIGSNYIPLTTLEGEGAYLYDILTGQIWNFELARRKDFRTGRLSPLFCSFFGFLRWYLEDVNTAPE